jgi:hypothetical protein
MVVTLIFLFLFAAILNVLTASNRSWSTGKNKLIVQQEARRGMDNVARLLRKSKPDWVTISSSECQGRNKILFYKPVFNGTGDMTDTRWVIIKPDPDDCTQLLKKEEGEASWSVIAKELESINFSGGDCPGCGCVFSAAGCSSCTTVTNNCPVVKINIKTKKDNEFNLSTFVTLRNYNITTSGTLEPPPDEDLH